MFNKYLLVVLLFHGVLSDNTDECVRYYFEDYDDLFTTESPHCEGYIKTWSHLTYNNSTIAAPNKNSKWYIRAIEDNSLGCTASFPFTMMPGALVEAYVYLETTIFNSIYVDVMQITEFGSHRIAGWTSLNAAKGWQVVKVPSATFTGNPPFQGYIRFLGLHLPDSVIVIDSFRYVPLLMDPEEECILYEDTATTPTDTPTTTLTPTPTPITTTPTTTTPTTDSETTSDTTLTTTSFTPITKPPKNLTNYFVEELFDFRKSIRIFKKRITKVVNFDGVEQPPLGLE